MSINFPNGATSGQTYAYNGIVWAWNGFAWDRYNLGNKLDDLTDVVISGVSAGDILYYSGSQWINKPFNDISIDGGTY
jgi:hypothetical protein